MNVVLCLFDDERASQWSTQLAILGHCVARASEGADLLEPILVARPDVVIVHAGQHDEVIEFCRAIRARRELRGCVLVGVVSPRDVDGASRVLAEGGDFIVPETLDRAALALLMVQLAHHARRHGQAAQDNERHAAALARSRDDLQSFAYAASHDLQEPLRTVAGFAQLLSKRYAGKLDAEAEKYINFILDGTSRMQQLIRDLLAFSRAGSSEFRPTLIDLEDVANEVWHSLAGMRADTDATLQTRALPAAYADRALLLQVFQHLFSNAIKFRGDEPLRVEVWGEAQGAGCQVHVRDNGIGFAQEFAERVFVIFKRLHTRRHYQGSGVGLAICKKIVERHGGEISVRSEVDRGSTFSFSLPRAAAAEPVGAGSQGTQGSN